MLSVSQSACFIHSCAFKIKIVCKSEIKIFNIKVFVTHSYNRLYSQLKKIVLLGPVQAIRLNQIYLTVDSMTSTVRKLSLNVEAFI